MAIALPKELNKSMSPAKRAWETRRLLPPGHMEIAAAEAKCKKEYEACKVQEKVFEKRWTKRNPRYLEGYQAIADFAASLCRALGTKSIKMAAPMEPEHAMYAGAYYSRKVIHCPPRVTVTTVVHETAHHIMALEYPVEHYKAVHGEKFCEVEAMLFAYLLGK